MKQESYCHVWKQCKKALAVSLSVVTAVSFLPGNVMSASAATKQYVSMRTTFKTLQVGQKNRMTLKNNTAGWKIQKISSNDTSIASVSGKTEKSFQIKANAVGRTTVKAVLKTTSRKKHNSKTVRCRVNVIAAADTPTTPEPEPEQQVPATEAEVSTQAQLDTALLDNNLKMITIRTSDDAKFVIPAGTYTNVSLVVDAPASDIENSGVFQSIEIRAVKPDTWIEKAVGNVMRISAKAARMIVNPGAHVKELIFPQTDADVKLEINGKADSIQIQSKMKLSIIGQPEADLSVLVDTSATDTQIVSEAPLDLSLHTAVSLTFEKGAENSIVKLAAEGIKAVISNLTEKNISVKRVNGTSTNVHAGQKNTQVSSGSTQNTGTGSTGLGWGSSSGSGTSTGSGTGTGSGSGTGTGSGAGTGSGTGSGSGTNSGSQDKEESDIPVPAMEEILKGITATCEVLSDGTNQDDTKVYWQFKMNLKGNVTFFEDQPNIELQYCSLKPESEENWYNLTDAVSLVMRSSIQQDSDSYQLKGSTKPSNSIRVYFRYADKEKETAGEKVETLIQFWNEEVIRQYVQDFLGQREADQQGKPFSMKIPVNVLQDQKVVMVYDKEQPAPAEDLVEFPQWTGAGPVVPEIQAADVIKAIDVSAMKTTVIISGSSVESLRNNNDKQGEFYCKVEIPIQLDIPENLPGGKCQWTTPGESWNDITDNKITYVWKYVWSNFLSWEDVYVDTPITQEFRFRYISAGGSVSQPDGLGGAEYYDSSKIVIQPFNKTLADACLNLIENNQSLKGEDGSVCCKFTLDQEAVAQELLVKSSEQLTADKAEPVDELPADWVPQKPENYNPMPIG